MGSQSLKQSMGLMTVNCGSGCVSGSWACSSDSFPSIGFALFSIFVRAIALSYCIFFCCHVCLSHLFPKWKCRQIDPGKRREGRVTERSRLWLGRIVWNKNLFSTLKRHVFPETSGVNLLDCLYLVLIYRLIFGP